MSTNAIVTALNGATAGIGIGALVVFGLWLLTNHYYWKGYEKGRKMAPATTPDTVRIDPAADLAEFFERLMEINRKLDAMDRDREASTAA